MRLGILDQGHRRRAKLFLALTGGPDIVRMLLYRPGFLTRPLLELTVPTMRGPSYWSAAEREYLAMCTAQSLQCPFCIDTHAELTRVASEGTLDPDDAATLRPQLTATRDFLAQRNASLVTDLPDDAVQDALRVKLVFDIIGRLANAFGFVLREGELRSGTRALHRFGYRFPGFLLADGHRVNRGDVIENLRYSVLQAPAVTTAELRTAAAEERSIATEWTPYVSKVRDVSYTITDDDLGRLAQAGRSEDAIFEVTAAAAVGVALDDYQAQLLFRFT